MTGQELPHSVMLRGVFYGRFLLRPSFDPHGMSAISPDTTAQLAAQLVSHIRAIGPVAVAFSGGVDSAVVAIAAYLAAGDDAVAVTAVSPSLARADLEFAIAEAARIGIRHRQIQTAELQSDSYRRNHGDRCFHCRDTMYSTMEALQQHTAGQQILNGANLDDLGDHRPGMQAAQQHHVRSPLIELNIRKQQVRELAEFWKLQSAARPASPCLASRIAYGVEVTPERLRSIELAEAYLRPLLTDQSFRVRLEADGLARIEVTPQMIPLLADERTRAGVVAEFRSLGFRAVTLDLDGFRSGNLNQLLVPLGTAARQSEHSPDEH